MKRKNVMELMAKTMMDAVQIYEAAHLNAKTKDLKDLRMEIMIAEYLIRRYQTELYHEMNEVLDHAPSLAPVLDEIAKANKAMASYEALMMEIDNELEVYKLLKKGGYVK